MAFIIISKLAVEADVKKIAGRDFLDNLDVFEWEKQLEILEAFKLFHEKEKANIVTDFPKMRPRDRSPSLQGDDPIKIEEDGKIDEIKEFDVDSKQEQGMTLKTDITKNVSPQHLVFYRTGDFRVKKEKALERMLTLPR